MTCTIDNCNNPCEGSLWICATHNAQKRKAERESLKVKAVKPIRKMSARRSKEVQQYSKLKKAFLEDKMMCEVRFIGCQITATEIHHISINAKNFLNTKTWKRVCITCHRDLEDMPAKRRRELGLLTD